MQETYRCTWSGIREALFSGKDISSQENALSLGTQVADIAKYLMQSFARLEYLNQLTLHRYGLRQL